MENNIIVGLGEVLWDVFPDRKNLGGAPANFAFHMAQFGYDSRVVSAIGKDALGEEIMTIYREKQLNTQIETVDYPTGTVQVTLDENGIPCYEIKENVAWDNIPFTPELEEIARHTRAVCFGSLAQRSAVSRNTINRFLDAMPDEESYKVFDINLRQQFYSKEIITNALNKCNILKINDEELVIISHLFGYKEVDIIATCTHLLQDYALKMLILTCGTNGSYVFAPGEHSYLDTPKVTVVDTVGAGDSFTAAFCAAILKGKPVGEAHRLAVDVSAFICSQEGAMPQFPAELLNRI